MPPMQAAEAARCRRSAHCIHSAPTQQVGFTSPMPSRIPVTLLTGFLGSGKTTLVNALLRDPALADTAVIVNELGDIALDHLLVESSDDNVKVLGGGCLCCVMQSGLRETLADLFVRRVNGSVPRFRRVLVETTGLADPGPIANALVADQLVHAEYALSAIVTTVDAMHGRAQLASQPESVHQAALADLLVITKCDLVTQGMLDALNDDLALLNPHARRIEAANGNIEANIVLTTPHRAPALPRWLGIALDQPSANHAPYRRLAPLGQATLGQATHLADITSISIVLDAPISWAGLAAWSALTSEAFGKNLLRVKGLVEIAETRKPVVVHAVSGYFHRPERLDTWPSDDHRSRLVIIARGIDALALRSSLKALTLPAGAARPASLTDLENFDGI